MLNSPWMVLGLPLHNWCDCLKLVYGNFQLPYQTRQVLHAAADDDDEKDEYVSCAK